MIAGIDTLGVQLDAQELGERFGPELVAVHDVAKSNPDDLRELGLSADEMAAGLAFGIGLRAALVEIAAQLNEAGTSCDVWYGHRPADSKEG